MTATPLDVNQPSSVEPPESWSRDEKLTDTSLSRSRVSRRDFLSLAWKSLLSISGLLGLAGLWRFLSYQPDPAPPTTFDLGPVDNFPVNNRVTIPDAQAVLLHTPEGLKAFSLVCPHLGCEVDLTKDGFACPCHGSRFGPDGALKRGPADRPLRSLALEVNQDGHLILDTASSP